MGKEISEAFQTEIVFKLNKIKRAKQPKVACFSYKARSFRVNLSLISYVTRTKSRNNRGLGGRGE